MILMLSGRALYRFYRHMTLRTQTKTTYCLPPQAEDEETPTARPSNDSNEGECKYLNRAAHDRTVIESPPVMFIMVRTSRPRLVDQGNLSCQFGIQDSAN